MKKFLLIIAAMLLALCTGAQTYSPGDMPNVQIANRGEYVSDPAGLLSPEVKAQVNRRLYELRKKTSVEMVVAIPPEIGDWSAQEWCVKLFSDWGIGKSDKDNGVLVMVSPDSRTAFIMPGYGAEGVLTDIACKKIIETAIKPAMIDGDLDAAVNNSTSLIVSALEDPAVADELRSEEADNLGDTLTTMDPEVIWKFVRVVAGIMYMFGLAMFVYDCVISRRRKSNYSKAEMWRSHLTTYFWVGVLSLGAGLMLFLAAFIIYRRWRTRRVKCQTCGANMKRLSEDKDNELLDDSQDLEEQLGTVDYDVWECPSCGTVERFPFKVRQRKYTECPACHTVAMSLECDAIVKPATTRTEGQGVKVYECKFCHNRRNEPYRIPRKDDPVAAAAAAAVLGSALGRGGGGGGFSGGGFGGGSTGGGGAGGSW